LHNNFTPVVTLYSLTGSRGLQIDGAKLRTELVAACPREKLFYGINFELSFNAPLLGTRNSGEIGQTMQWLIATRERSGCDGRGEGFLGLYPDCPGHVD
jgi:hypothetical protein